MKQPALVTESKTHMGRTYVLIKERRWTMTVITEMWDRKSESYVKTRIFRNNPGRCSCDKGSRCAHILMLQQVSDRKGWMK
jgi:hypothetical protein